MNNLKPSQEKPWLKFYGKIANNIEVPNCSIQEFLKMKNQDENLVAIKFYETEITYKQIFENSLKVAKSLQAMGFKENDQIPVFLLATPEFIYLLLGAEMIGASLVCRDGELEEIIDAISNSGAKTIFVHDFLTSSEEFAYRQIGVENIIYITPNYSATYLPDFINNGLQFRYGDSLFKKENNISWDEFLNKGINEKITYIANDVNKPVYRAYTTGTTGTSKQVIHTAHSIIGILVQMSFYSQSEDKRLLWECGIFPPSLVATTVAMILSPLASNKILLLNPLLVPFDYDLSMMYYKPNIFALIPMTANIVLNSKRIPDDFDMSFLISCGSGAEFTNNKLIRQMNEFFRKHNSEATYTVGYGMSEAGSNILLPIPNVSSDNCCIGIPMPLTTIGIFTYGTDVELNYGELGEICKTGEGNMYGYSKEEDTQKVLFKHSDGNTWLHTGDIGYITEDGFVHVLNRGFVKHFTGNNLFVYNMENKIIDIDGIKDAFFLTKEDKEHEGYFVPYLYIIPDDVDRIDEIKEKVKERLEDFEQPRDVFILNERPFFHMKTARRFLAAEIKD